MKTLRALIGFSFLLIFSTGVSAAFIDIKPIQICLDDGTGCATTNFFEAETDKIWSQAGIDVNFQSIATINNSDWTSVANTSSSTEFVDIMSYTRTNINDSDTTLAINMFFVDTMETDPGYTLFGLGCGAPLFSGFCVNEVGVFVSQAVFDFNGGIGRLDTIAHEIGHVLGLTHDGFGAGGAENLMTSGGSRSVPGSISDISPDGAGLSVLTDLQITEVYNSKFVQEVPEPSILFLLAIGLIGFGISKRGYQIN